MGLGGRDEEEAVTAAAWCTALDADARGERPLGADGWRMLTEWLEADPRRADLLDALETAPERSASRRAPGRGRPPQGRAFRSAWTLGLGGAVAAAVVAAAWLAVPSPPVDSTMTTGDAARAYVLADGTRVVLNRRGRLDARVGAGERRLRLGPGSQAAFDVTHDATRPFVVEAGEASVRVLGTRFDVDDAGGRVTVAVARGRVAVSEAGRPVAEVPAGRQISLRPGGAATLSPASEASVSGWTRGTLVYDAAPLGQVASDLSRYVGKPVTVDADAASLRFTGALTIDKGPAMLARLVAFMPIEAYRTPQGVRLRSAIPRR